jgi:hypothetical protein
MAGSYTIEKRDGRWWLITPDGAPFWSIGINHIDSAALRFAESDGVWEREFGNSRERWLGAVADDLRDWGFNTMGMMEGLYDWDGNAKPGLADVVREANKEFYERATQPYGSDRLSELDATLCRARDEVHKHVR